MTKRTFFALMLALGLASVADAQNSLTATAPTSVGVGSPYDIQITLDNSDELQGWSYGLCTTAGDATINSVVDGATTAAFNGGAGPDFNQVNILTGGYTVGVVISFLGTESLPAGGVAQDVNIASYTANVEGDVCVDFCSTLGDPPVSTVVVSGGASIPPVTTGACSTATQPSVTFQAPTGSVGEGGTVVLSASILDDGGALVTQGFSMDLGNDPAIATPLSIAASAGLASLNGGAGPDFFGDATFAEGWTVGVVYSFLGSELVTFSTAGDEVIDVTYQGLLEGVTSLDWIDTLGDPPVVNVVVSNGASIPPSNLNAGSLEVLGILPFLSGDCNDDALVNIADGIFLLNFLFQGGSAGGCDLACDVNDDGMLDSTDATYVFMYRFMGGAEPVAPFPACGTRAGQQPVDCAAYSSCP